MSISSAALAAARPLPPDTTTVILRSRRGLRLTFGIAGALAVGGGITAGVLRRDTGDDASGVGRYFSFDKLSIPLLATGAAAATAAFLTRPVKASVIETGIGGLDDAVHSAAEYQRAIGIVENEGAFHLVDIDHRYDLDNLAREHRTTPEELLVGDGGIPFVGLVTRDGDHLDKLANGTQSGYKLLGPALPPFDLGQLAGATPATIERALRGAQIGTDDAHNRMLLGGITGTRTGYASLEDAVKAVHQPDADRAVIQIGDRHIAFNIRGPRRQAIRTRGTGIAPWESIGFASRKSAWRAGGPAERPGFVGRVVKFTTDELVGQRVALRGINDTISKFDSSHTSMSAAERALTNLAKRDKESNGLIKTTNYAIVEAGGKYHVYRMDGTVRGTWEPELGPLRGITDVEVERKTTRKTGRHNGKTGQWLIDERRSVLRLHPETGNAKALKTSKWHETSRRFQPAGK